jgi:transposase
VDLTDEQRLIIRHLLLHQAHASERGRPPSDPYVTLNGIFWVMRTGSPWSALPPEYPSRKVCRRWYLKWKQTGILREALLLLEEDLQYRTGIRADDPTLERAGVRDRTSWWWQTVLLLRSADAIALLRERPAVVTIES